MLVLTRKLTERIQIGEGVVVTVLEIGRRRVRLGIDAPQDVHVVRTELLKDNSAAMAIRARGAPTGPDNPLRAFKGRETNGYAGLSPGER